MKIYLSVTGRPNAEQVLHVPGLRNGLNILILVHVAFFLLYFVAKWMGWLNVQINESTIGNLVNDFLAIPGNANYIGWFTGILIHQFVHISPWEVLLSMSVLGFFGHILQASIGERKVIILYLVTIVLSGIAFVLSHRIFQIFSGHGTIMEGAFAGALGVMTATVALHRSQQVRVFGNVFISLWYIYAAVLLLSLALLFKPSIAYVVVYFCSIWIGARYAMRRIESVEVSG